jgi:hypothetical protein
MLVSEGDFSRREKNPNRPGDRDGLSIGLGSRLLGGWRSLRMEAGGYVLFSLRGCKCGLTSGGGGAVAVSPFCDVAEVTEVDRE